MHRRAATARYQDRRASRSHACCNFVIMCMAQAAKAAQDAAAAAAAAAAAPPPGGTAPTKLLQRRPASQACASLLTPQSAGVSH